MIQSKTDEIPTMIVYGGILDSGSGISAVSPGVASGPVGVVSINVSSTTRNLWNKKMIFLKCQCHAIF